MQHDTRVTSPGQLKLSLDKVTDIRPFRRAFRLLFTLKVS